SGGWEHGAHVVEAGPGEAFRRTELEQPDRKRGAFTCANRSERLWVGGASFSSNGLTFGGAIRPAHEEGDEIAAEVNPLRFVRLVLELHTNRDVARVGRVRTVGHGELQILAGAVSQV